jgi:O-antigen ligase
VATAPITDPLSRVTTYLGGRYYQKDSSPVSGALPQSVPERCVLHGLPFGLHGTEVKLWPCWHKARSTCISRIHDGRFRMKPIQTTYTIAGVILPSVAGIYVGAVILCSSSDKLNAPWVPQAIAVVLGLLTLIATHWRSFQIPLPVALYVGWILWAGFTFVVMPSDTGEETLGTLLKVGAICVVFANVGHTPRGILIVASCIVAASVLQVLLSFSHLTSMEMATPAPVSERFSGIGGNANAAGMHLVLGAWMTTLIVSETRHLLVKLALLALVCLMVLAALYTGCRKAMLAVVLSPLMLYPVFKAHLASTSSFRRRLVALTCIAVGIGAAVLVVRSPFGWRITDVLQGRKEASAEERADLARAGWRMWLDAPIVGVGLAQFENHSSHYGGEAVYSHSTIVEVLCCTGLVGFFLYFGSLATLFITLGRVGRRVRGPHDRTVLAFGRAVLLLILFYSVFAVECDSRLYWPLLSLFAGYAWRLRRQSELVTGHISTRWPYHQCLLDARSR